MAEGDRRGDWSPPLASCTAFRASFVALHRTRRKKADIDRPLNCGVLLSFQSLPAAVPVRLRRPRGPGVAGVALEAGPCGRSIRRVAAPGPDVSRVARS